jgi:hypothetical protein
MSFSKRASVTSVQRNPKNVQRLRVKDAKYRYLLLNSVGAVSKLCPTLPSDLGYRTREVGVRTFARTSWTN